MQVGPLAQVLVGFAQGHEPTRRWAVKTLETAGKIAGARLTPAVLHSTLGRHAARMIRCCVLSEVSSDRDEDDALAEGVVFAGYDDLVGRARELVADTALRRRVAARGFELMCERRAIDYLRGALSGGA